MNAVQATTSLPALMQALRYNGPGQALRLEQIPVPASRPDEVLVQVQAAGICHTDLHLLSGLVQIGRQVKLPFTLGHEIAGVVAQVGNEVASGLVGERVLVYYYIGCGRCEWCRSGQENLCPKILRQLGFDADGGYAEYVVVPVRNVVRLPKELSLDDAATLGCSASTALHAARAIAGVRLGETVVVYGVGAVGLALVQVCRLAGARVIAIGRSPAKLSVAAELGADLIVNAGRDDPARAVLAATGEKGADVVFELVGRVETMEPSVAMLRRRGRLVFVGYSEDLFRISPLQLIVKEAQVLSSVGNTYAELVEVVELARQGRLRGKVACTLGLQEVHSTLAALDHGELTGRAIIHPYPAGTAYVQHSLIPTGIAAVSPGSRDGQGSIASSLPSVTLPEPVPPKSNQEKAPLSPFSVGNTIKPAGQAHVPPMEESFPPGVRTEALLPLEYELLDLIAPGIDQPRDEERFNQLALAVYAYQFAHNEPYRRYSERKGLTPERIEHWRQIPAVPITAFKETLLACEPIARAAALFMTSGTTNAEKRGRHYHSSLRVYDASLKPNWAAHLLPEGGTIPMVVLNPPPSVQPNSSLAHYLEVVVQTFACPLDITAPPPGVTSHFYLDEGGLQVERLVETLRQAEAVQKPICLLGTPFAFVHFLDCCQEHGWSFKLAPGSRLMDTGGFKGKSREIAREELNDLYMRALAIPANLSVNMYGMTELSTQFLDATLRNTYAGRIAARYKTVPPWARTVVLDPQTLQPMPRGEVGVLQHLDLANRASVGAILTEDLGYEAGDGFEIIGRIKSSEARGCASAIDELLSAVRGG